MAERRDRILEKISTKLHKRGWVGTVGNSGKHRHNLGLVDTLFPPNPKTMKKGKTVGWVALHFCMTEMEQRSHFRLDLDFHFQFEISNFFDGLRRDEPDPRRTKSVDESKIVVGKVEVESR